MLRRLDPALLIATTFLTGVGLLVIWSTGGGHYLVRQLLFLPAAVGALIAGLLVPRRVLSDLALWFYVAMLALLAAVLLLGGGDGARRWFMLGPLAFQPSEFAKIATVILLARHLAGRRELGLSFKSLATPVLICLAPALLILVEPDLSGALLLGAVLAAMLYHAGLRPLELLLLYTPLLSFAAGFSLWTWAPFFVLLVVVVQRREGLGRALIAGAVSTAFGLLSPVSLHLLRDYQRARVRSFLSPWLDPHGVGWNSIQSRIAIGSGRLWGKGLTRGTQNRLGFLPNRHTDFAFSCIGEELGLAGSLAVLAGFLVLVGRFLTHARQNRDRFSALLCTGCAAIVGYGVFVNIGMLLGLLPVTGVALPFISYGGSSLVLNYLLVGIVLGCAARPE
ncbi:rod shape-determining protein RodA [candidate division WOR-3 bacterium]|nr:rod shape-determining protein RodA [candidate division WOR-3 bacterium]